MVVGGIGHRAHDRARHLVFVTHLGDRGAFHLYGERVGQRGAQRLHRTGARDELIPADHEPAMHLRQRRAEVGRERRALFCHEALAGRGELRGETQVGGKARHAEQRHLETRKERRRIQIVLQQRLAHHDVADTHVRPHAARHAREDHGVDVECVDQRARGGRRGHLAHARERDDARRAVHGADVIVATPVRDGLHAGLGAHGGDQVAEFFG
jgi:hypothetical protein